METPLPSRSLWAAITSSAKDQRVNGYVQPKLDEAVDCHAEDSRQGPKDAIR